MTASKPSYTTITFASFPITPFLLITLFHLFGYKIQSKKDNEVICIFVCFTINEKNKHSSNKKRYFLKRNCFYLGVSTFSSSSSSPCFLLLLPLSPPCQPEICILHIAYTCYHSVSVTPPLYLSSE